MAARKRSARAMEGKRRSENVCISAHKVSTVAWSSLSRAHLAYGRDPETLACLFSHRILQESLDPPSLDVQATSRLAQVEQPDPHFIDPILLNVSSARDSGYQPVERAGLGLRDERGERRRSSGLEGATSLLLLERRAREGPSSSDEPRE